MVLVIVLLLFGAKRLPELGRSLDRGIKEFKEGLTPKEEVSKETGEKPPEAVEGVQENPNRAKATQEEEQHQRSHKKEAADVSSRK
ncbi:MAG TPA: twin-arginine translocase TatA/TatE family subunit [Rubrobacteraceae bacterium]|nr:twin-arginine translocase TatA/TatE family subunit [Rubrobacteraceae bacterium]